MRVLSVNVSTPRPVEWRGRRIMTGIFKLPVEGPVLLRGVNLDGDAQADLSVHGGPDKAVYAYPSEHYLYWRTELGLDDLPWGSFGENLTLEGWWEDHVAIGDRFRVGTAEVVVTQPRTPCFKLGLRFGREDVIEKFLDSGRSGFYLRVAVEGELEAGASFERIEEDPHGVTVAEVNRLYLDRHSEPDVELLQRAIAIEALAPVWKEHFLRRLAAVAR